MFPGLLATLPVPVIETERLCDPPPPLSVTITFVQGLQLSFSLDSLITPSEEAFVLSAQTRIEGVLPTAKEIEGEVTGAVAPLARAAIEEGARSVIVPPPLINVAVWKKFEKEAPVEVALMFLIVAVYV
jgi:hypothetical protein